MVCSIETCIPYKEYTLTSEIAVNIGSLKPEQGQQFRKLLEEFSDPFASDITELGHTNLVTHKIYTEDVPPIRSRPYSMPSTEQTFIKEEIQQMLDNKLIQPSCTKEKW